MIIKFGKRNRVIPRAARANLRRPVKRLTLSDRRNAYGLHAAKGQMNGNGKKFDWDIMPAALARLIKNYPIIRTLERWAWRESIKPVGGIRFVPDLIDGTIEGTEHGFLIYENFAGNRIIWRKLFPNKNAKQPSINVSKVMNPKMG
jgi:hypothetical protein